MLEKVAAQLTWKCRLFYQMIVFFSVDVKSIYFNMPYVKASDKFHFEQVSGAWGIDLEVLVR